MQITIHNEKREILVQTVSIAPNEADPENLYLFRCPYDGETLGTQIRGNVVKISPGLEPRNDVPTFHLCRTCKRLYTFQTLEYSKGKTKIVLVSPPAGAIGIFYCYLCRNPILQFVGDKIVKLPDFKLMHVPFEMDCVNPSCPAKYKIADVVQM